MSCSPEKLAANRRNCLQSTGPKTPEGKAKSRRNGLKHGLTGAGVVIPDEDQTAVQERFIAFEADLKPRNSVAQALAMRAAILSVRLERCVRQEAAKITQDMQQAHDLEAETRAQELAALSELITKKPVEAVRKLRRTPEGIDWLIESWKQLRERLFDAQSPRWAYGWADNLAGRDPNEPRDARLWALSAAMDGKFDRLGPTDWPDLPDRERRDAARSELARYVDDHVAGLQLVREGLDHELIAQVRAGAAARAIFDPSREAERARKYEATAERGFFRSLKEIERINAAETADAKPDATEYCGDLASSLPDERDDSPPLSPAFRRSLIEREIEPASQDHWVARGTRSESIVPSSSQWELSPAEA